MQLKSQIDLQGINPSKIINIAILAIAGLISINIIRGQISQNAQLEIRQQEQRKRNETLVRVDTLQKTTASYKQKLPPRDEREIINTIAEIATASQARVSSLGPRETTERSDLFSRRVFNLSVEVDDYHHLARLINMLENEPAMLRIDSLRLKFISDTRRAGIAAKPEKINVELIVSYLFFIP